jgi:hypothetical protein
MCLEKTKDCGLMVASIIKIQPAPNYLMNEILVCCSKIFELCPPFSSDILAEEFNLMIYNAM